MSTTEEASKVSPANSPVKTQIQTVTKVKNPRRVEQGKKLTDHDRKMKQQLAKMKLGEASEPSSENEIYKTVSENENLIFGGLAIGALAVYLIRKNKSTPMKVETTQPIVQPKSEANKEQPEILDME